MKRYISSAVLLTAALALTGCGNTAAIDEIAASQVPATRSAAELAEPLRTTAAKAEGSASEAATSVLPADPDGGFDIDLTQLSSSVVYGQVYDMINNPDDYLGKTVRMSGPFAYYLDAGTGEEYFAVLITDAKACCSQGIEFVLEGDHTYPDDYPAPDEEITVVGRFNSYKDSGYTYCQLLGAEIV